MPEKKQENNTQVLRKIKREYDNLTPAQKAIAGYIIQNSESLYFMSITKLADETKVSVATIVRFCNALGYKGYSELIEDVQEELQSRLNTSSRFQIAQSSRLEVETGPLGKWGDSAFPRILDHEIDNLRRLVETVKIEQFNQAVEMIHEAHNVLILGSMASTTLAKHMGRMMSKIKPMVDVLDDDGILNSTKLLRITPKTVVCIFAFPRYPSLTVRLAKDAVRRGGRVISVTDSSLSPISGLGELTFYIQVGIQSYVDAYAAPLTFINALCAELAESHPDHSKGALMAFDDLASKNDLFVENVWRGRPRKNK